MFFIINIFMDIQKVCSIYVVEEGKKKPNGLKRNLYDKYII